MNSNNQETVILASTIFDVVKVNKWVDKNGSRTKPVEEKTVTMVKKEVRKRATSANENIYHENYY